MYEGMCTECGYMEEVSYDKSGLKNPDKADLDKNKDISSYEKKRGAAIEKNMSEASDKNISYLAGYADGALQGYEKGYFDGLDGKKYDVTGITKPKNEYKVEENDSEHGKKFDKAVDSSELNMLKKLYAKTPTAKIKAMIDKLEAKMNENHEGTDHEVSMANNSIDSIIWAAHELKKHLQGGERDIPAWIQDHITNAENYILQAAKNYHEYGSEETDQEDDFSGTYDDGLDETPIKKAKFDEISVLSKEEFQNEMSLQEMIKKVGSKYNVYSKKGKKLGSHPSKKKAQKQMAAIEISKQGK